MAAPVPAASSWCCGGGGADAVHDPKDTAKPVDSSRRRHPVAGAEAGAKDASSLESAGKRAQDKDAPPTFDRGVSLDTNNSLFLSDDGSGAEEDENEGKATTPDAKIVSSKSPPARDAKELLPDADAKTIATGSGAAGRSEAKGDSATSSKYIDTI